VAVVYVVQHGEKEPGPGDPGLTDLGLRQAARTAGRLRRAGLTAVFSSPLRRAHQTAQVIASAAGLAVAVDARLRERVNWDGEQPLKQFRAAWARSVRDRDFVPPSGDSSRQAGRRFREFLDDQAPGRGPVAAVTHGGVTVDLLRTLLGDDAVPARLLREGVPPCAVSVIDGRTVVEIASVAHLDP
jgi:broad specificity phosphatase PhoE